MRNATFFRLNRAGLNRLAINAFTAFEHDDSPRNSLCNQNLRMEKLSHQTRCASTPEPSLGASTAGCPATRHLWRPNIDSTAFRRVARGGFRSAVWVCGNARCRVIAENHADESRGSSQDAERPAASHWHWKGILRHGDSAPLRRTDLVASIVLLQMANLTLKNGSVPIVVTHQRRSSNAVLSTPFLDGSAERRGLQLR